MQEKKGRSVCVCVCVYERERERQREEGRKEEEAGRGGEVRREEMRKWGGEGEKEVVRARNYRNSTVQWNREREEIRPESRSKGTGEGRTGWAQRGKPREPVLGV